MKVATGRVVEGRIVLEGEPLAEGAVVTVVAREDDDTFDVSPEEERALLDPLAFHHRQPNDLGAHIGADLDLEPGPDLARGADLVHDPLPRDLGGLHFEVCGHQTCEKEHVGQGNASTSRRHTLAG